ncbi:DUF819 family protein [Desulfovibrio sp. OttesenSCG-928-I05]|nr:DUF819 family protein [Desulfovibrio sp. OttesenSCG-928-I05]
MTTLISADNTWALWAVMTMIAAGAIILEQKYDWASKMTGCVIALIGAMILSNLQIIPVDAPAYDAVWGYVVPLAIPMLLFKADVKKIWKESGRTLLIYLISGAGTIVGGFTAYYMFGSSVPEPVGVTAMMVGTYSGGSVNLVAMADAFKVSGGSVSTAIVADNLLMAIYFFVLAAIPTINWFRSRYGHPLIDQIEAEVAASGGKAKNQAEAYWQPKPIALKDIGLTIGLAFAIVSVSTELANFLGGLFPSKGNFIMVLLGGLLGSKYLIMTTITMALATIFPKFMQGIAGSQEIGTFLIHIFFTVIGVPASIYLIMTQAPMLLVFCAIMVAFNMLFSFGFGKIFKFNLEEICVASNANIGGPTTAAALAVSKGWTALIIPSILVGTLGYVIGNYYGITIGTFLGS